MEPARGELPDSQLIHEEYSKNPYPFWVWLFVIIGVVTLMWASQNAYRTYMQNRYLGDPFLQVTNRELSLFLWQNPLYMRPHAKTKTGYLTGFQYLQKVNIEPGFAEQYAAAPPELLFLYHTWSRLLKPALPSREVPAYEFAEFLEYVDEWQPANWPNAPGSYIELVKRLDPSSKQNLQSLLPLEVRWAFQGWKNYFKEGSKINQLQITYAVLKEFLEKYPMYGRSYWRNISGAEYLKTFTFGKYSDNEPIPREDLEPFLKVAIYNSLSR